MRQMQRCEAAHYKPRLCSTYANLFQFDIQAGVESCVLCLQFLNLVIKVSQLVCHLLQLAVHPHRFFPSVLQQVFRRSKVLPNRGMRRGTEHTKHAQSTTSKKALAFFLPSTASEICCSVPRTRLSRVTAISSSSVMRFCS